ncbi:hypothetical protein J6590_107991, partial [Homalodisca vitripennis]
LNVKQRKNINGKNIIVGCRGKKFGKMRMTKNEMKTTIVITRRRQRTATGPDRLNAELLKYGNIKTNRDSSNHQSTS